jgi:hypothetical protein
MVSLASALSRSLLAARCSSLASASLLRAHALTPCPTGRAALRSFQYLSSRRSTAHLASNVTVVAANAFAILDRLARATGKSIAFYARCLRQDCIGHRPPALPRAIHALACGRSLALFVAAGALTHCTDRECPCFADGVALPQGDDFCLNRSAQAAAVSEVTRSAYIPPTPRPSPFWPRKGSGLACSGAYRPCRVSVGLYARA